MGKIATPKRSQPLTRGYKPQAFVHFHHKALPAIMEEKIITAGGVNPRGGLSKPIGAMIAVHTVLCYGRLTKDEEKRRIISQYFANAKLPAGIFTDSIKLPNFGEFQTAGRNFSINFSKTDTATADLLLTNGTFRTALREIENYFLACDLLLVQSELDLTQRHIQITSFTLPSDVETHPTDPDIQSCQKDEQKAANVETPKLFELTEAVCVSEDSTLIGTFGTKFSSGKPSITWQGTFNITGKFTIVHPGDELDDGPSTFLTMYFGILVPGVFSNDFCLTLATKFVTDLTSFNVDIIVTTLGMRYLRRPSSPTTTTDPRTRTPRTTLPRAAVDTPVVDETTASSATSPGGGASTPPSTSTSAINNRRKNIFNKPAQRYGAIFGSHVKYLNKRYL